MFVGILKKFSTLRYKVFKNLYIFVVQNNKGKRYEKDIECSYRRMQLHNR